MTDCGVSTARSSGADRDHSIAGSTEGAVSRYRDLGNTWWDAQTIFNNLYQQHLSAAVRQAEVWVGSS